MALYGDILKKLGHDTALMSFPTEPLTPPLIYYWNPVKQFFKTETSEMCMFHITVVLNSRYDRNKSCI